MTARHEIFSTKLRFRVDGGFVGKQFLLFNSYWSLTVAIGLVADVQISGIAVGRGEASGGLACVSAADARIEPARCAHMVVCVGCTD